jgi:conserved oligomeric Golgi complex subunit 8
VIDDLREPSRASNKRTLAKLLKRLEDQIQLPECLRVVGHLRRSRYFDTETSLRRAFLARREIFVRDACEDASRWLAPYERAKKLTDVHRVHVFDVVTQYRAIFSDDVDDSDGVTTTSNNNSNVSTITVTANESMVLLSAWASQRAESYRSALDESLARIDEGGALASVFEHCEYCGNSLARVGVETRPLLRDIFEKHALRIFEDALGAASEAFEKSLSTHRWTTYLGFTASSSEQEQESKNKTGDDAETNNNNTNEFAPPQSLLEHAPVAAFVNGVLAAFNEVRLLSPKLKSCRKPFAKALRKTFENGKTLLKNEERAILKTGSETKKEAWSSAWTSLESCAAPYCAKCFDKLLRLDANCDGRTASALLASLSI